ncbi:hypothetical protein C8J57DRAFT_1277765 [Mycena rebaudengoi]|nr:hypothetical protein C8J57DRAFT_1277765 [Mycena rebaudengoi]
MRCRHVLTVVYFLRPSLSSAPSTLASSEILSILRRLNTCQAHDVLEPATARNHDRACVPVRRARCAVHRARSRRGRVLPHADIPEPHPRGARAPPA